MTPSPIVFLVDVDNTLLDNARIQNASAICLTMNCPHCSPANARRTSRIPFSLGFLQGRS